MAKAVTYETYPAAISTADTHPPTPGLDILKALMVLLLGLCQRWLVLLMV
jgi:hypothetical protein